MAPAAYSVLLMMMNLEVVVVVMEVNLGHQNLLKNQWIEAFVKAVLHNQMILGFVYLRKCSVSEVFEKVETLHQVLTVDCQLKQNLVVVVFEMEQILHY